MLSPRGCFRGPLSGIGTFTTWEWESIVSYIKKIIETEEKLILQTRNLAVILKKYEHD